jgi:hypothetical protein
MEIQVHDMAERIERRKGAKIAEPFWEAYRRMIYTDRPEISDAEIMETLRKGADILAPR